MTIWIRFVFLFIVPFFNYIMHARSLAFPTRITFFGLFCWRNEKSMSAAAAREREKEKKGKIMISALFSSSSSSSNSWSNLNLDRGESLSHWTYYWTFLFVQKEITGKLWPDPSATKNANTTTAATSTKSTNRRVRTRFASRWFGSVRGATRRLWQCAHGHHSRHCRRKVSRHLHPGAGSKTDNCRRSKWHHHQTARWLGHVGSNLFLRKLDFPFDFSSIIFLTLWNRQKKSSTRSSPHVGQTRPVLRWRSEPLLVRRWHTPIHY